MRICEVDTIIIFFSIFTYEAVEAHRRCVIFAQSHRSHQWKTQDSNSSSCSRIHALEPSALLLLGDSWYRHDIYRESVKHLSVTNLTVSPLNLQLFISQGVKISSKALKLEVWPLTQSYFKRNGNLIFNQDMQENSALHEYLLGPNLPQPVYWGQASP